MPRYVVNYFTETQYNLVIEADSYEDACIHWMDSAYWDGDPQPIGEDMMDTDVYIEEME